VRTALALVLRERFAQLLNANLLLLRREDDLPRQHHAHRPGRVGEKRVERHAETTLDVLDGRGQIGADLGRALHAERRDRVADKAAGLHEPSARPGLHRLFRLELVGAARIGARRAGDVAGRHVVPPPRQHQHRQRLRLLGGEVEVRHHGIDRERAGILEMRHVPRERGPVP
jgi:hypothetical protein